MNTSFQKTSVRRAPPPHLQLPIQIIDIAMGLKEGETEDQVFIGTPISCPHDLPYEYPFPDVVQTSLSETPALSNDSSTSSSSSPSSHSSHSAISSNTNSPVLYDLQPHSTTGSISISNSRVLLPPRLHSRIPSAFRTGLELHSEAPVPPSLVGRNLGKLSPAFGLKDGACLTESLGRQRGKASGVHGDAAIGEVTVTPQ